MEKSLLFFSIVSFAIVFACAKPIPQFDQNDLEYSAPEDSGNRAFWFGRPYYDENDGGGDNNFNPPDQQPSPTVSYTDIGGGWGR
ncbi:uncharacterized protein LOC128881564 [Hylaeus volcanicus]|uniref:uncharacterized protein LOC128881564 n=1 Tax=Hylaeus volcanicus TaxID=313075 RepID=UPI0023B7AA0F|nr:uncharacterized protein LOC128881564 [Hylaeus volcanicus]